MSAAHHEAASLRYTTLREIWGDPGHSGREICAGLKTLHAQAGWAEPEEARLQIFNGTPLTIMALAYDAALLIGSMSMIVIVWSDVTSAVMENVVVHADYRGRGIGRKLFDLCRTYAQQHRAEWIALQTNGDDNGAHSFYNRLGFYPEKAGAALTYDLEG